MQDQQLTCRDCGASFVWTVREQEFYKEKGFDQPPSRCPDCRRKRKAERQGGFGKPREMFEITCSNCGNTDTVPFKPSGDRPVLCRNCFQQSKGNNS